MQLGVGEGNQPQIDPYETWEYPAWPTFSGVIDIQRGPNTSQRPMIYMTKVAALWGVGPSLDRPIPVMGLPQEIAMEMQPKEFLRPPL